MTKRVRRTALLSITAGADASMDVLATLFVSFVLLFALAVMLSGGNRLLANEQYVLAEILLLNDRSPTMHPPAGALQVGDMKPYPKVGAPTVKLERLDNGDWGECEWIARTQETTLDDRCGAYSRQSDRRLTATATAQRIESACDGAAGDCRKYIVVIRQLARGTYRLRVTSGFFTDFDSYSVVITVTHPYQTTPIRMTLDGVGNRLDTWIPFTFDPKVNS